MSNAETSSTTGYTSIRTTVRDCNHTPLHDYSERTECKRLRLESEHANRKRTKEVFPTDEIPHIWAHKVQPSARNAQGNLYFRDSTIFSYGSHFPIARHVTNKAGKPAVLFTTDRTTMSHGGSPTTSGHISAVRSAVPPDVLVFNIPNAEPHHPHFEQTEQHDKNLAFYKSNIDAALVKASRGRSSWKRESQHESAVKNRAEYNAYLKFFGLRNKPLAAIPALDSKALEAIKAKEATRIRLESEKTKRERAERLVQLAETIQAWRDGQAVSIPYDVPTMLRVDGHELETSRGARVPLAHAKRALVLIRAVVSRGEDWQTNGHTCHVGHYRIDRIEANGTVKAGCHVIDRAEWERVAPALDAIAATETEAQPQA
jgi:hypothetical protein